MDPGGEGDDLIEPLPARFRRGTNHPRGGDPDPLVSATRGLRFVLDWYKFDLGR
jgi:hypothetical protein